MCETSRLVVIPFVLVLDHSHEFIGETGDTEKNNKHCAQNSHMYILHFEELSTSFVDSETLKIREYNEKSGRVNKPSEGKKPFRYLRQKRDAGVIRGIHDLSSVTLLLRIVSGRYENVYNVRKVARVIY